MSTETKPVYRYSERKFAEALDLDIRTIKRYVASGKIRSVKLSPRCRRLEDPADFQARQAEPAQMNRQQRRAAARRNEKVELRNVSVKELAKLPLKCATHGCRESIPITAGETDRRGWLNLVAYPGVPNPFDRVIDLPMVVDGILCPACAEAFMEMMTVSHMPQVRPELHGEPKGSA